MASFRLLAVAGLAVVLMLSSAQNVYAGQVGFWKHCIPMPTSGYEGPSFQFAIIELWGVEWTQSFLCSEGYFWAGLPSGTYVFTELVSENPPGWVLRDIVCERHGGGGETWWEIEGSSVTIHHDQADDVDCHFINVVPSAPSAPVGGVVTPVNTFAVLSPWFAVIGLVGCVATVVVVARKSRA